MFVASSEAVAALLGTLTGVLLVGILFYFMHTRRPARRIGGPLLLLLILGLLLGGALVVAALL